MSALDSDVELTAAARQFVAVIQAHGSDARDSRDAAHEACHALRWKVRAPWTRDNIHAKKPKYHRIFGAMPCVREEVMARAVEQLVCQRLGVECGSVKKWAMVCWMEQLKMECITLPNGDWLERQILECMKSGEAARMADRILALKAPSVTKGARKARTVVT